MGKKRQRDEGRAAKVVTRAARSTNYPDERKREPVKACNLRSVMIKRQRNAQKTQKIGKPLEQNQRAYRRHGKKCDSSFEISRVLNLVRWTNGLCLRRRFRHSFLPTLAWPAYALGYP